MKKRKNKKQRKRRKSRQPTLNIGDSVRVIEGSTDPDFGHDISGQQGRIKKFYLNQKPPTVEIEWDSTTLENTSPDIIRKSDEKDLDWSRMILNITEVCKAAPRDSIQDVIAAKSAITNREKDKNDDFNEKNQEANCIWLVFPRK